MQSRWMLRRGTFNHVSPLLQGGTPSRFTLWGIVNVTPDSFYDGGRHASATDATEHGIALLDQGARILDIGGASSRPGADDTAPEEELRRVLPVIEALQKHRSLAFQSSALLSVDTWRASVAATALESGADIINDVSACSRDRNLPDVLAQYRPGYVLTHCHPCSDPHTAHHYEDIVDAVRAFFDERMHLLTACGLPEDHIMLDPGIGFGKSTGDNCRILANIETLYSIGRPLLLGISNKSLLGSLLGLDVTQRMEATSVSTALLAAHGVFHHRVHDVEKARQALILTEHFTCWNRP